MADKTLNDFLKQKSAYAVGLFNFFVAEYKRIADVQFIPAKTMIGVATNRKRVAYVTQIGRDFIHVVFPFDRPFPDNLCFQKIAQVPGQQQFNHHFRMYAKDDLNEEVIGFMKLAYEEGRDQGTSSR